VKLTPEVYLVGGGDYSFNLSHRLDCHVYVIKDGDDLVMVDAGFDGPEEIVQNMEDDGLDPSKVSRIFVTHYHADHTGALARMKRLTGAKVYAGGEAAPAIRTADADQIGLKWAQQFKFYPPEFVWEATEVEYEFKDGEKFAIGRQELETILTPGHCKGHYCLLLRGGSRSYLFTSDLVFWGGTIILQNVADSSVQEYAASMNKVLTYEFDALLPGHSCISLRNGRRHVQRAANAFNQIGLPDNLRL
jgi:glyoxylase-like metal-dependent hydrolase (beta-lactamase superfamily II)